MNKLILKHCDFTLTIECAHYEERWQKGENIIGAERLTSTYNWTEGVERVWMSKNEDNDEADISVREETEPAFFFEQTDYAIWVEFGKEVSEAKFVSQRKDVNEHFSWKGHQHVLTGFLNYDNDIGRADFPLHYKKNGEWKQFTFSYDVISAKLDYHRDWKLILSDIEKEYYMLSLDYMRRTYHGISMGEGESYDLIWWNIFNSLQEKYLRAARNIIERPRHRLQALPTYKRADQIRRFTPSLEQKFAEHRTEESHLYYVDEQQHTHNTIENRFLKYTLSTISKHYSVLVKRIADLKLSSIDENEKKRFEDIEKELIRLNRHPFFRTIGAFEGLRQESLILQRDANYSTIYRTYNILRKSFSLNDGLYRMETKDIATLYEIWCFIEVSHIVKEILNLSDEEVENPNRQEMGDCFVRNLDKGTHSRIVFRKEGTELKAELYYNPENTARENHSSGIEHLESPTVPQKPDILLRLTKNDVEKEMKMTYLFDAKYRIEERKDHGVDVPPEDAINQMHRYRDAIYYKEYGTYALKKEVIGGYILFPGNGEPQDVQMARFHKSIHDVNIGAFPLRPKDAENRKMLGDFIAELINTSSATTIEKIIPPKGGKITLSQVLVLIAPTNAQEKYDWCIGKNLYPIPLDKAHELAELMSAEYAIIHFNNTLQLKHISRSKESISIKSKEELANMGYPEPSKEYYLVMKLSDKGNLINTPVSLDKLDARKRQGLFVVKMNEVEQ